MPQQQRPTTPSTAADHARRCTPGDAASANAVVSAAQADGLQPGHDSLQRRAAGDDTGADNDAGVRRAAGAARIADDAQRAQLGRGAAGASHARGEGSAVEELPRAALLRARTRGARGWQPDEAQLEYQRALQLDPELDLAKQAIAELSRRR